MTRRAPRPARPVPRTGEPGSNGDNLTGHVIEECGHIIPLHRPDALLTLLRPFLAG